MIDFHSHILPSIDDGSQSVKESLALLELLKTQNVDVVCATPHFYIQDNTPERFLQNRTEAFSALRAVLSDDMPKIRLGAEVHYFTGISHMKELPQLCLEDSQILLLEMPMCTWTNSMIHELMELSCSNEITVLLAHIERYLSLQKTGLLEHLLEHGILLQSNANFFAEKRSNRKALKMLRKGQIIAIGSDCHNLSQRPPRMDTFKTVVQKKLGDEFFLSFIDAQYRFLEESACVRSI